jgi:hypothetical protein
MKANLLHGDEILMLGWELNIDIGLKEEAGGPVHLALGQNIDSLKG